MIDRLSSLNFLELTGLVFWACVIGFWVLTVGWLCWCAVEGRKAAREQRERAEDEARIVREWMENEERRWSERCTPVIAKVIEDSKQGSARWT